MSLINASAGAGGVIKSGGCDGCADASAVSEQQISGRGTFTFVASESASLRFVGLGSGGIGTGAADINFALRLQNGGAEVREAGAYKTEARFAAGDTFGISVDAGAVRYSKNGSVFYTSALRAGSALRVHVVLFSANAAVASVAVSSATTVASAAPASLDASAEPAVRYAIPRPAGSVPRRR
jgi:hypothetical protein